MAARCPACTHGMRLRWAAPYDTSWQLASFCDARRGLSWGSKVPRMAHMQAHRIYQNWPAACITGLSNARIYSFMPATHTGHVTACSVRRL